MTNIYILGSDEVAITYGYAECKERGGIGLPFFAVAPMDQIVSALDMKETESNVTSYDDVNRALGAFREHGTVMFFDNIYAADRILSFLYSTIRHSVEETDWRHREIEKVTIQ